MRFFSRLLGVFLLSPPGKKATHRGVVWTAVVKSSFWGGRTSFEISNWLQTAKRRGKQRTSSQKYAQPSKIDQSGIFQTRFCRTHFFPAQSPDRLSSLPHFKTEQLNNMLKNIIMTSQLKVSACPYVGTHLGLKLPRTERPDFGKKVPAI